MKIRDEFNTYESNQKIREYNDYNEFTHVDSTKSIKEFTKEEEYSNTNNEKVEETQTITKKKSSTEELQGLVKSLSLVGVSTGAVVGISAIVVLTGGVIANNYNTEIIDISTTDNTVSYIVDVGETEDLSIKIEGDNFSYEIKATPFENSDTVEGLKPDTTYTLVIYDKDNSLNGTIKEEKFTTLKEHIVSVSEVDEISITYECKCNIDGYFHFNIDYQDTENYYTFSAKLVDGYGNESECVFNSNYHDEQIISIDNLISYEEEVQFIITCTYLGNEYVLIDTLVFI